MSQENVEVVRRGFDRWEAGGGRLESVPVDLWAKDIEWDLSAYPLPDVSSQGKGRDSLFKALTQYFSGWRNYQAHALEFIPAGDDVVVVLNEHATVADSDVVLERDVFQVWTVRDGLVSKWRVFETRAEALEAVGLAE